MGRTLVSRRGVRFISSTRATRFGFACVLAMFPVLASGIAPYRFVSFRSRAATQMGEECGSGPAKSDTEPNTNKKGQTMWYWYWWSYLNRVSKLVFFWGSKLGAVALGGVGIFVLFSPSVHHRWLVALAMWILALAMWVSPASQAWLNRLWDS